MEHVCVNERDSGRETEVGLDLGLNRNTPDGLGVHSTLKDQVAVLLTLLRDFVG